ncbi:hypothetical protein F5J12DRAFT_918590 [Pisolithus orientalis]|uniref:uncharacterized protein n=1 Tax=Pisolithus orientalis TaxID=936130 RepID=UPI00222409A2|nr:uncharacterized protein F5J12DRAFT_918590 [Pisolithus orientalis]KAI6033153.1 hypothetical protein F5J12DRAFT_918590 [Pisolithus orientalis]
MGKYFNKALKAIMKSRRVQLPKYDWPIRFRPWFLLFTFIIMILLAIFGFTDIPRSLPLRNKLLHFVCFCLATGVFYFIFDAEEDARRIWFWRHSGLIFTAITCFFFGGVISEVVQSLLPHKQFDFGDVVANISGSAIGLFVAYYLERYYRTRREPGSSKSKSQESRRLGDVWDEREELFGIGHDDGDSDGGSDAPSLPSQTPRYPQRSHMPLSTTIIES